MTTEQLAAILQIVWFGVSGGLVLIWLMRSGWGRRAFEGAGGRHRELGAAELLAVGFVLVFGVQIVGLSRGDRSEWGVDDTWLLVLLTGFFGGFFVLMLSGQRALGDGGRFGFREGFGWKTLGVGLWTFFLGTGVTLLVLTVTVEICARLGNDEVQVHQTIEALKQSSSVRVVVILVVQALVIAPVMEEVLFRGFFQSAMIQGMMTLRRRVAIKQPAEGNEDPTEAVVDEVGRIEKHEAGSGIQWIAIAVTSLLFAGSHSISNWQHLPALWVLGLFLGYSYERRGTLAVPILIHVLFNALPIVVTMVGK